MATLRFGGSVWCNIEIALRNLDHLYQAALEREGLDVIGAYILRALYDQDGLRPSDLARAVGRAPTSFTVLLDKLESNGLIERRSHTRDRRSILIYLTKDGNALKKIITEAFYAVETQITDQVPPDQLAGFYSALQALQQTKPGSIQTSGSWMLEDAIPTSDVGKAQRVQELVRK